MTLPLFGERMGKYFWVRLVFSLPRVPPLTDNACWHSPWELWAHFQTVHRYPLLYHSWLSVSLMLMSFFPDGKGRKTENLFHHPGCLLSGDSNLSQNGVCTRSECMGLCGPAVQPPFINCPDTGFWFSEPLCVRFLMSDSLYYPWLSVPAFLQCMNQCPLPFLPNMTEMKGG